MKLKSSLSSKKELAAARTRIARLDRAFLEVFSAYLAERAALARHIGKIKRELGISVRDPAVEQKVHARFLQKIGKKIPGSVVRTLSDAILRQSREQQKR